MLLYGFNGIGMEKCDNTYQKMSFIKGERKLFRNSRLPNAGDYSLDQELCWICTWIGAPQMRKRLVPALFWHFCGIFIFRASPDLLWSLPSWDCQDSLCNFRPREGEISTLENPSALGKVMVQEWHQEHQEDPHSSSLSTRRFEASINKVSKTHERIKAASPRYFIPSLIAVGFELPIIFKNGSKFFIILAFVSKTWGLGVTSWIFAIQERYHKYPCLKRLNKIKYLTSKNLGSHRLGEGSMFLEMGLHWHGLNGKGSRYWGVNRAVVIYYKLFFLYT